MPERWLKLTLGAALMGNQRQGLTDSEGEKGQNCGSQAAYPVLDDGAGGLRVLLG